MAKRIRKVSKRRALKRGFKRKTYKRKTFKRKTYKRKTFKRNRMRLGGGPRPPSYISEKIQALKFGSQQYLINSNSKLEFLSEQGISIRDAARVEMGGKGKGDPGSPLLHGYWDTVPIEEPSDFNLYSVYLDNLGPDDDQDDDPGGTIHKFFRKNKRTWFPRRNKQTIEVNDLPEYIGTEGRVVMVRKEFQNKQKTLPRILKFRRLYLDKQLFTLHKDAKVTTADQGIIIPNSARGGLTVPNSNYYTYKFVPWDTQRNKKADFSENQIFFIVSDDEVVTKFFKSFTDPSWVTKKTKKNDIKLYNDVLLAASNRVCRNAPAPDLE
jgi:hypothetical protein